MVRQILLIVAITLLAQTPANLTQLSWISGCWESRGPNRVISEQWMKPDGDMMMGMSRTVSGGKATEYEFLQIRQQGSDVFYVAKPSRQEEGSFKLIRRTDREAIFENPEHDFPQRIIYRLQPDGSLLARIEGKMNGADRGIDFPMKRVNCP